jgi:hypothetical protein
MCRVIRDRAGSQEGETPCRGAASDSVNDDRLASGALIIMGLPIELLERNGKIDEDGLQKEEGVHCFVMRPPRRPVDSSRPVWAARKANMMTRTANTMRGAGPLFFLQYFSFGTQKSPHGHQNRQLCRARRAVVVLSYHFLNPGV